MVASAVSARTQPLRIVVSPVHLEDEDLRGFEEHLSYRDTAFVRYVFQPVAVYEFEQHGAATAMHLKIELCGDKLTLIRARPDSCLFEEPDEVGTLIGLVPCG
ncbi:hypothetical protein AAVH_17282 [Aphelenchoides avenae]|nr:hypothetical protein AAVH_17282 [Aphelenchus avenae]